MHIYQRVETSNNKGNKTQPLLQSHEDQERVYILYVTALFLAFARSSLWIQAFGSKAVA